MAIQWPTLDFVKLPARTQSADPHRRSGGQWCAGRDSDLRQRASQNVFAGYASERPSAVPARNTSLGGDRGPLGEVVLIGVVGSRFEVGTDLGPEVLRALPEVLKLVAEHVRRHGERAELRTQPLPVKEWQTSEQRV